MGDAAGGGILMAQTQDPKVIVAEIGRSSLLKALRVSAGMNMMEGHYQKIQTDLRAKQQIDEMVEEVRDLPEWEKLSEILCRFVLIMLTQARPEHQPIIMWHLYTHLRSTGLIQPVKPNIGSIVDLAGRRIPPKEEG
jgi:hypothetical protein